MRQDQAESAVTASALIVGGVYLFRRLSETDVQLTNAHGLRLKQLAGAGPVMPAGPFVVGWGFSFLVISLMTQVSPKVGGWFALLVAAGAVLGNGEAVFTDLDKKLGGNPSKPAGGVPSSGIPQAPPAGHLYPQHVIQQGNLHQLGTTY